MILVFASTIWDLQFIPTTTGVTLQKRWFMKVMAGTQQTVSTLGLTWVFSMVCLFFVGCGPCASLQRDFDARMRQELQYMAVDDRVELSGVPHGYLHIGPDAFEVVSASALKDEEPYFRTVSVTVPEHIWGYKGQIRLETSLRLDHIDADFKQEGWGPQDVALDADVMVRARIEVPGKRARWTWYARATLQTQLQTDAKQGDVVEVSLKNAVLSTLDANLPWLDEGMPDAINDLVANGISDAIDAVLLEHQADRFAVMRIHPLNFTSMSLSVRVASAQIDPEHRALTIAFQTALRPMMTWEQNADDISRLEVPSTGILLQIPRQTLDAALRQQSLRGTTPTSIRFSEDDEAQWQAFWGDSAFEGDAWRGTWDMWCFDRHPCKARAMQTTVRIAEEEERLAVSRDPVMAESDGERARHRDSPVSLAELQRLTLGDMTREIMRWFGDEDQPDALRTMLHEATFHRDHLDARFTLQ